jgi:hypothetical protein
MQREGGREGKRWEEGEGRGYINKGRGEKKKGENIKRKRKRGNESEREGKEERGREGGGGEGRIPTIFGENNPKKIQMTHISLNNPKNSGNSNTP